MVVGLLAGAMGLGVGYVTWHHTYPAYPVVLTYTGRVEAVSASRDAFAIKPDPGTAHADQYYSGGGDVSFAMPAGKEGDTSIGRANVVMGAHVRVTVVMIADCCSPVVEVQPAQPG